MCIFKNPLNFLRKNNTNIKLQCCVYLVHVPFIGAVKYLTVSHMKNVGKRDFMVVLCNAAINHVGMPRWSCCRTSCSECRTCSAVLQVVILVVDSTDRERLSITKEELACMLANEVSEA